LPRPTTAPCSIAAGFATIAWSFAASNLGVVVVVEPVALLLDVGELRVAEAEERGVRAALHRVC
jgi:hypothetical protein